MYIHVGTTVYTSIIAKYIVIIAHTIKRKYVVTVTERGIIY